MTGILLSLSISVTCLVRDCLVGCCRMSGDPDGLAGFQPGIPGATCGAVVVAEGAPDHERGLLQVGRVGPAAAEQQADRTAGGLGGPGHAAGVGGGAAGVPYPYDHVRIPVVRGGGSLASRRCRGVSERMFASAASGSRPSLTPGDGATLCAIAFSPRSIPM